MSIKQAVGTLFPQGKFKIILLLVVLFVLAACSDAQQSSLDKPAVENELITVRLGSTRSPPSWLVHIALENGFFKQQGLNVESTNYKSGKRALKGMLNGQVDLATTAEGPVVFFSLIRHDFSVVSTIGIASNDNLILARKDAGIKTMADLKGKAIATQIASSAHYYLHLFLAHNNYSEPDIIQSFMDIDKLPDAIVSGVADAVAIREPFFSQAKARLGDNAITFETPGLYLKSFLLAASNDYIDDNPETIFKFLSALLLAEQFAKDNKQQTSKFLVSKFNLTKDRVTKILRYLNLSLSLDQDLLLKLEDEAKWVIKTKLTDGRYVPDFLDLINSSALVKVKPTAMTITDIN